MKAIFFGTLLALTIALPSLGATLERQNVRLFKLTESTESNGSKSFRIRGMSNGSLCVCDKPKTKLKKDTLFIEIPKAFISPGLRTGPYFDVTLSAPASVRMIVFGKNQVEIWPHDKVKLAVSEEEEQAQLLAKRALLEKHPDANIEDYSIQFEKADPNLACVTFIEWSDGRPRIERKFVVDMSKKMILNQSESLL